MTGVDLEKDGTPGAWRNYLSCILLYQEAHHAMYVYMDHGQIFGFVLSFSGDTLASGEASFLAPRPEVVVVT